MSTTATSPSPGARPTGISDSADSKSLLAPAGVVIQQKAVVPRETELKGEITIGSRTVLHPSCKILAINGPIVIGEGNIIEEKVEIVNRYHPNEGGSKKTLYIGSRNLLEAYSGSRGYEVENFDFQLTGIIFQILVVEGNIGNNNTVSCKARIGPNTTLSTGCVVGCLCVLDASETLPPDSIVLGLNHERRVADVPQAPPFIDDHLDHLHRYLPTYHHILKSSVN